MESLCIAIEGIDGSGKRTLAENLKKKFGSETTSKFAFGDFLTSILSKIKSGRKSSYYFLNIPKNC